MPEIRVSHTHLYKGARGRILTQNPTSSDGPTLVQFADDVTANGWMIGVKLMVESYRTRAGTIIPAKAWRLRKLDDYNFVVDGRETLPAEYVNR